MSTRGRADGTGTAVIRNIRPTIYFAKDSDGLKQGVDVAIRTTGRVAPCSLSVRVDRKEHVFELGSTAQGVSNHRVFMPDIRVPKQVRFRLLAGRRSVSEKTIKWKPQRHWMVHLCQFAHFDPGYTDLPSNVMREYLGFLDDVVEWCERTRRWPKDARFHYIVEQAWAAMHYVENRPPEMAERFARCCREGQIEVNALFANMTSELMGPEEMARLMYPAFQLKRRYGIPIRTAEHNDVPGISWAYATILADAGIEYFVPAIPDYFHDEEVNHRNFADDIIQRRDRPEAFYWEAQTGDRVLVYLHRQGAGGNPDSNLVDLPPHLEHLDREGYAYNVFRYAVLGGSRDNAPPRFDFADTVKKWNRKWAYPRYVMSTNHLFYTALKEELSSDIPVYRGDYPGTDYTVGATSTAEAVGVNRNAKSMLLVGERMAAIASEITDCKYPRGDLDRAYLDAMRHDEHAWGLSSPIGWAADGHRKESDIYAYRAAALAHDVLQMSVNRIADEVAIDEDGYHIVVFNPLDRARTDVVDVPFYHVRSAGLPMRRVDPGPGELRAPIWDDATAIGRHVHSLPSSLVGAPLAVVDVSTGESIPHQVSTIADAQSPVRFAGERHALSKLAPQNLHSLTFVAHDVPAMGYKTYRVAKADKPLRTKSDLHLHGDTIENRFYKVTVDRRTGGVLSIYDKELRRELVDARARYQMNQWFTRAAKEGVVEMPTGSTLRRSRVGPVLASLEVRGSMPGAPQRTQGIVLYNDLKRIDFNHRILKDADGTRCFYVAFPFKVPKPRFRFEGPLNVIRPIEDQLPGTTTDYYAAQHWVHVGDQGGSWGIAWSGREAPMVQLSENWPDYVSQAHHGAKPYRFHHEFLDDPSQFKKGHIYSYVANNNFRTNFAGSQPGPVVLAYSMTSRRGDWREGGARDFGWGFCNPLVPVVLRSRQSGPLPAQGGFCEIDRPNVVLTTIKRAEDGDDLIIRLLETEGVRADVTVRLPFHTFTRAVETNVVEEDRRRVRSDGSSFTVRIQPWRLATVRLTQDMPK